MNCDSLPRKRAGGFKKKMSATVSVSWGYEIQVSIRLTPRNWVRVRSGKPLHIRGKGYHYEGEFFWDYWSFDGGLEGTLCVSYGQDGGVGFSGGLFPAMIEEVSSRSLNNRVEDRRSASILRLETLQ
jgi:hypothetical protein